MKVCNKHIIKSKNYIQFSFITNTQLLYAIKFYPNIVLFKKKKNFLKNYFICKMLPTEQQDTILLSTDKSQNSVLSIDWRTAKKITRFCFIRLASIVSDETFSRQQREQYFSQFWCDCAQVLHNFNLVSVKYILIKAMATPKVWAKIQPLESPVNLLDITSEQLAASMEERYTNISSSSSESRHRINFHICKNNSYL